MSVVEPTDGRSHRKFRAEKAKEKDNVVSTTEKVPELDLTSLLDKFLRYCSNNKGLKERTVKTYKDNTRRLIKWLNEEKKVTEPKKVTGSMVDDYIDERVANGNSKGYANIILRNTKPFFKWLTMKKYIDECPYDGIKLLKVDKKKMDPIPEEDFTKLISIPPRNYFGSRDVLILKVIYGCGLRIGECLNMTIDNVDFRNSRLILEDTKNGEDSYVPLPKYLEKPLRDYISEYLGDDAGDRYLFQNQDGNGLSYRSFESNLTKYCKQAKLPHYKCHQFRHNFAMSWIKANGDVASLQRILRHKDAKMVNIYLDWTNETLSKEMRDHNPLDRLYGQE